ncbi:MAG: hypothetical protein PHU64_01400 [Candidatus Omnitrophica bacterium]|nr:hypothetical protein [Candidatus Omnitrophota bacterium]MDD5430357.1 hypothetical protein [Candidatus Omnitrophota bacterium]
MTSKNPTINTKAFSLLELLILIVLIGIIAGIAIPGFHNYIEKQRARNAQYNLVLIYQAQKRYKLDSSDSVYCLPGICSCSNTQEINESLGLNIKDPYFEYNISKSGIDGFTAIATRISPGPEGCAGKTMSVTEQSSQAVVGAHAGGDCSW